MDDLLIDFSRECLVGISLVYCGFLSGPPFNLDIDIVGLISSSCERLNPYFY